MVPYLVDQTVTLTDEGDPHIKFLGDSWASTNDTLVIRPTSLPSEANTKPKISFEIASLLNSIGFLSPIVIRAKCFLQGLQLKNLGWDDKLPNYLQKQ